MSNDLPFSEVGASAPSPGFFPAWLLNWSRGSSLGLQLFINFGDDGVLGLRPNPGASYVSCSSWWQSRVADVGKIIFADPGLIKGGVRLIRGRAPTRARVMTLAFDPGSVASSGPSALGWPVRMVTMASHPM